MILTSQDKLRAILRSLENVIIPAINPEAGQAREQAQFAAMHCQAMLEQVNWEYAMEVAEAGHFADLCRTLASLASSGDETTMGELVSKAASYAEGPPASFAEVRETVLGLRKLADGLLVAALEGDDQRASAAATKAVLAAARRHEVRTRAWVQESSYETGDVPATSIADSLQPGRIDALLAAVPKEAK